MRNQQALDFVPTNLSYESFPTSNYSFVRAANELSICISSLLDEGIIQPQHIHGDIVDFGPGSGGSTYTLARNSSSVTAVDIDEFSCDKMMSSVCSRLANIAPAQDGVRYLLSLPADSLDMVTAFMFGPDFVENGSLAKGFYRAANRAIKPDGRILVTSDWETVAHFEKLAPVSSGIFRDYNKQLCFVGCKVDSNFSQPTDALVFNNVPRYDTERTKEGLKYFG